MLDGVEKDGRNVFFISDNIVKNSKFMKLINYLREKKHRDISMVKKDRIYIKDCPTSYAQLINYYRTYHSNTYVCDLIFTKNHVQYVPNLTKPNAGYIITIELKHVIENKDINDLNINILHDISEKDTCTKKDWREAKKFMERFY